MDAPAGSGIRLSARDGAIYPSPDHGPVFGLATPTNPQGGWSFDLGVNGRSGVTSTLEAELSYGLTQNIKLAVSGPVVFQPDPYPRSSVTTNTPMSGDFSGLAWWRFQKKDFAGKRIESTAVAGPLIPGPQQETGVYRGLHSGPGYLVGAVTGVASRSQYAWAGTSYQRYAESKGDRRPDLLTYTGVYGYRPFSWRTITRDGIGAFLGNSQASEPARFSDRILNCRAAEQTRCFSAPVCSGCIAPLESRPGCSFRSIAMPGRSIPSG
jgi:hypothetical protein